MKSKKALFTGTGLIMMVICSAAFIPTRQPYAGIICFSVLLVKGFLTITNGSIQMNLK